MNVTVDLVYGLVAGDVASPRPPQRLVIEIAGLIPLVLKAIELAGVPAPTTGNIWAHVVVVAIPLGVTPSLVT
jgi:hypothetical protein